MIRAESTLLQRWHMGCSVSSSAPSVPVGASVPPSPRSDEIQAGTSTRLKRVASTSCPDAEGTAFTVDTCTGETVPNAEIDARFKAPPMEPSVDPDCKIKVSTNKYSCDKRHSSFASQQPSPKPVKSVVSVNDSTVSLHVYDFMSDERAQFVNGIARRVGTGAFHAGVEVYMKEYSFRSTTNGNTGVNWCKPRGHSVHKYREKVVMGCTHFKPEQVERIIYRLSTEWLGKDYDLLTRNCCHFSDALCKCLGVGRIPTWVTSLAGTGAKLRNDVDAAISCMESCSNCEIHIDDQFLEGKTQEFRNYVPSSQRPRNLQLGPVDKDLTVDSGQLH